jgi:4-hydroxybenzoate polyprenyltransferase
VDRDDDLAIGMKTSAITLGRLDVLVVMLCYLVYMGIWAMALAQYALGAMFYVAFALALGQVVWHYTLIRTRSRAGCFKAFRLNHWLGFTLFAGIAASFALK